MKILFPKAVCGRNAADKEINDISGAIFDVDGTLLDSMCIWEQAGARYLKTQGVIAPDNLAETLFKMSVPEAAEYMKETFSLNVSVQEITEGILKVVEDFYYDEAQLKPGAKELLFQLKEKNIPMVIATSSNKLHIEHAFRRLGILELFEGMVTCEEAGRGKRFPDVYLMAARLLDLKPQNTMVFEDVLHAVQTAAKAGFMTCGIYDEASMGDWEEIKKTANIYMEKFI